MNAWRAWFPSLLLLLALAAAPAHAERSLQIAVPENVHQGEVAQAVLQRAYVRLELKLLPRPMPLRRGLHEANSGRIDGDLMRRAATLQEWDALIPVRVPILKLSYMAYRRGDDCPASLTIEALGRQRVAYLRGARIVETALPAQAQLAANDNADALRMLRRGLADYALVEEFDTDLELRRQGLRDVCKVAEPVLQTELFHSLHRKHAALVPRLERVLGEMERQGEIARIWAEERRSRSAAP